jgi:DNA-directed RNA polymerase specialized sigma54-like protein
MKIASLAELKKELKYLSEKELQEIILDLGRFSRENKAYLFFKLFEKENPRIFVEMVKEELEHEFQNANTRNFHFAKKSAQTIRKKLNKQLKLSKDKTTQIELIIFFCQNLKDYGYLQYHHPVITNLFDIQMGKAQKLIEKLHEDLQYDYQLILDEIM